MNEVPVLQLDGLTILYRQNGAWLEAVCDISLRIEPGQNYGLVGESGSGKTTLAMGVMRYLPENGKVAQGSIRFKGQDLLGVDDAALRDLWGTEIGLVPQNPLSSLNPSLTIGEQLAEGLILHRGLSRALAADRVIELLQRVQITEPQRVIRAYPHQISGGMQQRVLIAMALSTEPALLVLDEPTTSLDVTTQASILDLIRDLIRDAQTAVLYVTHNLGVVAQICDRVAVMYAGELVEDAPVGELFRHPLHPYTRALLNSVPRIGENKAQNRLEGIPGQIPPLGSRPDGCVFRDRCPLAIEICRERPPLYVPQEGHNTRCHRWEALSGGEPDSKASQTFQTAARRHSSGLPRPEPGEPSRDPMLTVEDVKVHFNLPRSLAELLSGKALRGVRAVDGVTFAARAGKTLGLVGESGSGKTTLARAIAGLVEWSGGEIRLGGVSLPRGLAGRDRKMLSRLQMVFQNPEEALNPYRTVGETLRRPLITLMRMSRKEAGHEVGRLLALVHLPEEYSERRPAQLSGGEKQRVAIARVFASHPDLLLADEPVSSLDVSVQASILNLLDSLQVKDGSSQLFISHDLAVVGYLADEVAVIYLGNLMEVASARTIFDPPFHPYTEALLSAVPVPDPAITQERIRLQGEIPGAMSIPGGCPFHTRCPRFLGSICVNQTPPWRKSGEKRIFCHIPLDELSLLQSRPPLDDPV